MTRKLIRSSCGGYVSVYPASPKHVTIRTAAKNSHGESVTMTWQEAEALSMAIGVAILGEKTNAAR